MGKLGHADVVHLLVQLSVMLVMGRLFAELLRKMNQPAVIGEILAGILLGPTVLGMLRPDWFEALYPVGAARLKSSGYLRRAVVGCIPLRQVCGRVPRSAPIRAATSRTRGSRRAA